MDCSPDERSDIRDQSPQRSPDFASLIRATGLLEIHPHIQKIPDLVKGLSEKVEGRNI